ncbi:Cell wall mannoprotein PIR3 [Diplodia seriata]|uniref:Cell wall mannoprotein PIR3 n=1 Tax=Diplodia seriata TaxID=420778 RepID=A0A1S8BL99_9PEZI|nr:Cell wall mannoprotein PIR3 [Diplodia seriata]
MKSYAAAAAVGALVARGVHASPFPQAVTAAISPSAAAPSGCSANYSGSFGIAVVVLSSTSSSVVTPSSAATSGATANVDVQEAAVTPSSSSSSAAGIYVVSQIGDGQIQAPTAGITTPIYTPVPTPDYTSIVPISEISDGQPQAPAGTPTPATPLTPITTPVISPPSSSSSTESATTVIPISEISDGQPQAPAITSSSSTPSASSFSTAEPGTTVAAVSQISDGQIQSSTAARNKRSLTACATDSTLTLTLTGDDGVLRDARNRTGYVASNYQFQFDAPPQSGALYTAGFSVCGGGDDDGEGNEKVLALGGSKTWYRCLSGEFYNLYDRWWAEQCEEVGIEIVELVECE